MKTLEQANECYETALMVSGNQGAFKEFMTDAYVKTIKAAEEIRRLIARDEKTDAAIATATDEITHITLPVLIPHVKDIQKEKSFLRRVLFPVIEDMPYYKEPVMIVWITTYRVNCPDCDNRDWKAVLDVLNEKLFADDNPASCSQMFLSRKDNKEQTDIYIVPMRIFKEWYNAFTI